MPITIGSVGDIIALSLLIKDLIKCFDDARGSSTGYQIVIREVYSLDDALQKADVLFQFFQSSEELVDIRDKAIDCVTQCQNRISNFIARAEKKYNLCLRAVGSGNWIKDAAKKVMWSALEKEALPEFQRQISGHCNSINLLLMIASM